VWAVRGERALKLTALGVALVPLALSTALALAFDPARGGYQFVEVHPWIPALGASLKLGVDGISLPMVWLTALLTVLVFWFSWDRGERAYYSLFLLLEVAVLGVFASLDLFLFYVFWELVLVPMYFIIQRWGGPRRAYASLKFFVYTFAASMVMLVGIMALYFGAGVGSFDLEALASAAPGTGQLFQVLAFAALFVGFAVKMPQVPFHTWLPDAHVEAPTGGSAMLAGVLLKMGSYGLIRVALPLLPAGAKALAPLMMAVGILSVLYGALVCLAQRDLKRLVAYSSISHMGMVLIGISLLSPAGVAGAALMMFAHGLISPLLFMASGAIHHGAGTRELPKLGGLALRAPRAAVLLTAGALASLGLPGMAQFVAEFVVLLAAYQLLGLWVWLPALTVVLTAGYYLWALQRGLFGPASPQSLAAHDLRGYEFWPMLALLVLVILFGVWPRLWLDPINASVLANALGGSLIGWGGGL
jgi:NADH-quinone oxidoreductase subunit M